MVNTWPGSVPGSSTPESWVFRPFCRSTASARIQAGSGSARVQVLGRDRWIVRVVAPRATTSEGCRSLLQDIEAEVETADVLGEGSYRDQIYAGGGDLSDAAERDAAAGFYQGFSGDLADAFP